MAEWLTPCLRKDSLSDFLSRREEEALAAVEQLSPSDLAGSEATVLTEQVMARFGLTPVTLDESAQAFEELSAEELSMNIRVKIDPHEVWGSEGPPPSKTAVVIPFVGSAELLDHRPRMVRPSAPGFGSPENSPLPAAEVLDGEIRIYLPGGNERDERMKKFIKRSIQEVNDFLEGSKPHVEEFNRSTSLLVHGRIEKKRLSVVGGRSQAERLGLQLQRRPDPGTSSVPVVRRTVPDHLPQDSDPSLPTEEYEHVLGVLWNMNRVLECSPHAFQTMKEEDLRSHFLVQLNGHYEGQATGETFNYQGKTDISIRMKERIIFVAECKFWAGPKSLLDAIDQLLGYVSWRETKTAIILFNRNKGFSEVLAKIPGVMTTHPNFKSELAQPKWETSFSYVFKQRDDPQREFLLTVMAFEIPAS